MWIFCAYCLLINLHNAAKTLQTCDNRITKVKYRDKLDEIAEKV